MTSSDPSSYPTGLPSIDPDYVDYSLNVGSSGFGSVIGTLNCSYAGCSDRITFGVQGKCNDPTLSVTVVETDYLSSSETAYIYVNGDYIASCEPLGM